MGLLEAQKKILVGTYCVDYYVVEFFICVRPILSNRAVYLHVVLMSEGLTAHYQKNIFFEKGVFCLLVFVASSQPSGPQTYAVLKRYLEKDHGKTSSL